jgi:hypothetical protein
MSGELSNYGEAALLDHLLKNTAFTPPTNCYFGISRADPGDDGTTIDEPTGEGSYARVQIVGATGWDAASGRQITNNGEYAFPQVTSAINGATHIVLFDAATNGNYLGKAAITADFEVGSIPTIEDGAFVLGWATGGLSTYAANKLLEHYVGKSTYSQLTNLYAFLSEGSPGDDFSGVNEPSGNGYARVAANSWTAVSAGAADNSALIQFPKATGDWRSGNNLTYAGLYDASSAGNGLVYFALTTAVAINTNERPQFAIGDFNFTID